MYFLNKFFNYNWYNFPFGNKPRETRETYLRLAEKAKNQKYPEIASYEKHRGFTIDRFWLDELALHTQITIKKSELCYAHGRVLYTCLSEYLSKYTKLNERINIFETGTARGFSSLCMAKALEDQNRSGLILTFDNLPHSTKMFWNSIDDFEGPKSRSELLSSWKNLMQNYIVFLQGDTLIELEKVEVERINFCFLDGSHTYKDVMFEFKKVKDKQLSGDIIVYDDYTPGQFSGIVKAVDEICEKYNYDRIDLKSSRKRGYVIAIKK